MSGRGGLEGAIAGETTLSSVDGGRGELILRGHRVQDLAGVRGLEAALGLLIDGSLPDPGREEAIRSAVGAGRAGAWALRERWLHSVDADDPMDGLRSGLASLPAVEEAAWLVGAAGVLVPTWNCSHRGLPPRAPNPELTHASDLLRLLDPAGAAPSEARSRALDTYLVAVVDHGFNASTFAARVVASTGSDLLSAAVAGVGALKGPLHGGAPGPVLDMLDEVGAPPRAVAWVAAELAAGRRLMGFGHRVYRVRDPRAEVLEAALEALQRTEPSPEREARLALAQAVERAATSALARRYPDRPMFANVEFATALLLEALGIDRVLFPAIFACGRIAGWAAHVAEQHRAGRLIRPRARYVGPRPAPPRA